MTATDQRSTQADAVAACTAVAAHRRDHAHRPHEECHPHDVEVVHLGHLAVAVCHDCGSDSGFVPEREAENISMVHRQSTLAVSALFTPKLTPPAAA